MRKLWEELDARDVHAYTGIALLSVGLGFIYWPMALIAPGCILLYMALRRVG